MATPKQDYFTSIQFLRGISAFLVLLCHSIKTYELSHPLFRAFLNPLGSALSIFLVISGFIIPYSMYKNDYVITDFNRFMFRRIIRLEIPYIISIIFVILLYYINTLYPWYHGRAFSVNWRFVLGHIIYLNTFTGQHWLQWVYWTLAVEFQFYILLGIIYPLLTHRNKKVIFATFFALLLVAFINIHGRPYFIFRYLVFFLTGISLFLYMTEKIKLKEMYLFIAATYLTFCYLHGSILSTPMLHICTLITLPCIYYIKKVPKMLLWLGSISYSLYLTHMVLTTRFIVLFQKYLHMNFYVAWVLCIICCLIFAFFFYILFEKPFLKLSKKIKIHRGV